MDFSHEKDNLYDLFSIHASETDSPAAIVGHIHMEVSRITKFITHRGEKVVVKIRESYTKEALSFKVDLKYT